MNYRISKLREYLFDIIDTLTKNNKYQINADMLGDIGDYSLNKIPTDTEVESWIIGVVKRKDIFSFRSRRAYSQDEINNLTNIGFFEEFESKIPQKVKICLFNLIEKINSYVLTNVNGNIASESIDGYSVNYNQVNEIIKSKNTELEDIMLHDLYGVVVNGEHIIYNG